MRKLLIPALLIPALVVGAGKSNLSRLFDQNLPKEKRTLHALNRLTFGPRPGDLEAVRKMGVKKWIDLQLHPALIPENPDLLARLKPLDSLSMPTQAMLEHYPSQNMIQALVGGRGRNNLPSDPVLRARTERVAAVIKVRLANGAANPDDAMAMPGKPLETLLDAGQVKILRSGTEEEKARLLNDLSEDKLGEVFLSLPPRDRRPLFT